jgi:hypothetical protein
MSASEKKPRPSMATLMWLRDRGVDIEAAVDDFEAFSEFEALGNRIGRAVQMTECIAGSLARGTIGRRKAVEFLREMHQALFELGRDLEPGFPPQSRERDRWNLAANGLAPWQPAAVKSENQSYGNGEGA